MLRPLFCLLLGVFPVAARPAETAGAWQPVTWNGERALRSTAPGRVAVVSLERGRLMHFGPADRDINLVLAPATRANRNRLGGHRLWLGPQAEWPKGWPPPEAWEYREATTVAQEAGVLRLTMAATDDDWPRLTRTYHWAGASLVCGAEFAGGSRPAQFVQILQVPPAMAITAAARPEEKFPAGYVQLPSTAGPFSARFPAPPQVTRTENTLALRHNDTVVKLGFRPQTLTGRLDGYELQVARGAATGSVVGEPDEGFHTQVYLSSGGESFGELEQLSPLFAPDRAARFEMVLSIVGP